MTSLQIPPDTWKIRNLLFEMPVPFSMCADIFETFWPLVDNIWTRYDKLNKIGRGVDQGIPYDAVHLECRFARKFENEASYSSYRISNPQAKRQCRRREGGTCSCKVKAKYFHGIKGKPDHYRFEHANEKEDNWVHTHTIDDSDGIKVNSYLRAVAAIESAKGYRPAEVYKNMRSVQLMDEDGNSLGDALDAAGGKCMTPVHVNNAKLSALSANGALFLPTKPGALLKEDPDAKNSLKRPNPEDRVEILAGILSVDPSTVWPETLGKTAEDTDGHAKNIKNDIRVLVESIAIGGRTEVPKHVLMPLLNSMAEYMDKTTEAVDGKLLLSGILKIEEKAAAGAAKRESIIAKRKLAKPTNLDKWNSITLDTLTAKHPDKSTGEVVQLLIDALRELQYRLPPTLRNAESFHNKVVTACQGSPACRHAVEDPPADLGQLLKKLQSSITAYEKEQQEVVVLRL